MPRRQTAASNTYWPETIQPAMSHRHSSKGRSRALSNAANPQSEREMNNNWPHPSWVSKPKQESNSQPSSASSSKSFAAQQTQKSSSRSARNETERERNRNWPHPAPRAQAAPPKQAAPTPAPVKAPIPLAAQPTIPNNPSGLLQVQVCPLLCRGSYELVDYDLRVPLDYARKYLPPSTGNPRPSSYLTMNDLRQPACFPPRPVLYVTAPTVYPPNHPMPGQWMITISYSAGAPHVTVRDVLTAMYELFHSPPKQEAWQSVDQRDPALREAIVKAYKKRCTKRSMKLNTSVDEQRTKGLMCLDWFGAKTYFGGLQLVMDGGQSGYEIWEFDTYDPTLA